MSYIPKYEYDVFISYASLDDNNKFISSFREKFTEELEKVLPESRGNPPKIYWDVAEVRGDKPISEQILSAVRESACMLVFHSTAYENSTDWCCREYDEFTVDQVGGQKRHWIISLDGNRIKQSGLRGIRSHHYRSFFYIKDGDEYPFSFEEIGVRNSEDLSLNQEVIRLARRVASTLEQMRDETPVKRVVVASSSERWKNYREDIKNWFTQHKFIVTMQSHWAKETPQLEKEAHLAIERCDAFISIAEPESAAKNDPGWDLGQRQLKIAKQLEPPVMLHWLPHEFSKSTDQEIKDLRAEPDVRVETLEIFKGLVKAALGEPFETKVSGRLVDQTQDDSGGFLLVVAKEGDVNSFDSLITYAVNKNLGRDVLFDSGTDESWAQSLKNKIEEYSATALVFADGNCEKEWIDTRLSGAHVMKRDLAVVPQLFCCECPPTPKDPLRFYTPDGCLRIDSGDLSKLDQVFE
jgi:hypothetical protein